MPNIRTRFAPSPTGSLHIGSLRTALFAYLIAKSRGGEVLLRIEDTDQKRYVEGAVEKLIDILDWVGIKFDEGPHVGGNFGPYIQSERTTVYSDYSGMLLEQGSAYRCFCTPERLQKMRDEQQARKQPPRYDRRCRNLSQPEADKRVKAGETFVIRQKMPDDGTIKTKDELRGEIRFRASELDDHVLIKSDGIPTYHFAVVIDDHLMGITHVLRGEEWLPSFPRHIELYRLFGWDPPKFIHMPLTLNKGGGKLSKRQGDVAVEDYRAKGYLPDALINFCVLLGWHPKDDREIFTLSELVKEFRYEAMGTSPAVFDIEKLDFLNGYYIRHTDLDRLAELCRPYLHTNIQQSARLRQATTKQMNDYVKAVIRLEQERMKKLSETGELTEFFFKDELEYEPELLVWKKMPVSDVKANLDKISLILAKIPEKNWTNDSIEDAVMSCIKMRKLKVGEWLWPMRAALTGRKASPGPFDVAEVLGKEESLRRIRTGVRKI